MHDINLAKMNAEQIVEAVAKLEDVEDVQTLATAEQAGKNRVTVLRALDARLADLDNVPGTGGAGDVPSEAVDVDGYWAQVLQGDIVMVRNAVERVTSAYELDAIDKLEMAGRKRAGVFMVTKQRRVALMPPAERRGKVKPPVWLDETGEVRHLNGVTLVGPAKPYPERGYVAQVYEADLPGHSGTYKAHLSLVNGLPIGGTMGDYLRRIYTDDGE